MDPNNLSPHDESTVRLLRDMTPAKARPKLVNLRDLLSGLDLEADLGLSAAAVRNTLIPMALMSAEMGDENIVAAWVGFYLLIQDLAESPAIYGGPQAATLYLKMRLVIGGHPLDSLDSTVQSIMENEE